MSNSFRDIELLSTYLDGKLNPSDSARLESRIKTDPELAAALNDLRVARGVLRKLPSRRAPRNFTLTPKMAGLKAPLPRSYPILRFASVFAAFLLFLTVATNAAVPYMTAPQASNLAMPAGGYGMGGGGGGDGSSEGAAPLAPATEAPAATEAPFAAQSADSGLASTSTPEARPSQKSSVMPTATLEETLPMGSGGDGNIYPPVPQSNPPAAHLFSTSWQLALAVLMILFGGIAWISRVNSERKFKKNLLK